MSLPGWHGCSTSAPWAPPRTVWEAGIELDPQQRAGAQRAVHSAWPPPPALICTPTFCINADLRNSEGTASRKS